VAGTYEFGYKWKCIDAEERALTRRYSARCAPALQEGEGDLQASHSARKGQHFVHRFTAYWSPTSATLAA
jgi:hypothetical protein